MKKTLFFSIAIIFLGACNRSLPIGPQVHFPEVVYDTIITTTTRTVTDTVVMAPMVYEVHDTVPCPAGLVRDSLVFRTRTVTVPGKTFVVTRTVTDTVYSIQMAHDNKLPWKQGADTPFSSWLLIISAFSIPLLLFIIRLNRRKS